MAELKAGRQPGPQIAVDPRFDRIQWRVERAGWVAMAFVIVLALLGFLGGDGPLLQATDRAGESKVQYNRIIRFEGLTRMELRVPGSGQEARVIFNEPYLSHMEIESVHPQPETIEAGKETVTYVFALGAGERAADVTFTLRPRRIGVHSADIRTEAGSLSIWQFAFP